MTDIIYLIAGVAAGIVATFLVMRSRIASQKEITKLKDQLIAEKESEAASAKEETEQFRNELSKSNSSLSALQKENEILIEQAKKSAAESEKRFQEQIQTVKSELQNASHELLKARQQELENGNKTNMDSIITPLKETINEMKKSMMQNTETNVANKASIEKAIEDLMKRTSEIGEDADKLAKAIKNESKVQGNWGELILESILERSELKEGIHYDKQTTLRDDKGNVLYNDESNKRMIPDIIVHYPDNKDLIIDSKVSLTAFYDYCNAPDEATKEAAVKRHLDSVCKHVDELAKKNYSSYITAPRKTLDYVVMFVPNESALQLALYTDQKLWRESFERGVFITSEQNLLALLRMIQLAWTQVKQVQNQQKVFDTAQKMLDRISAFVKEYEAVGASLEKAQKQFNDCHKKIYSGNQSVIKAANELIALGAKASTGKTIPEAEPDLLSSASEPTEQ